MTTINLPALNDNLSYQSAAIFELAAKGLVDLDVAKQAVIMVNKLREINRIVIANHGEVIPAHNIKTKVDYSKLEEIYNLQ